MWQAITNLFRPRPQAEGRITLRRTGRTDGLPADRDVLGRRRFEVADSTTANEARWARVDSRSINQLLQVQLREIHQRTAYEVRNNPIVEGTIATHCRDVIGTNGPQVQVEASNDAWARQAEEFLQEWMEAITADGRQSVGDWLRDDIRDWWQTGDMLAQLVEPAWVQDGVRLRVHPLDSRGLVYSWSPAKIVLGIERDEYRRPINYYLSETEDNVYFAMPRVDPKVIPARDVMHDFAAIERGQIRGFPLMTQALDVVSELREHDSSVLKAAQRQALLSILMQTVDETTVAEENPDEFAIKDGGITRIPPGWAASPMMSTQPGDNHVDYRKERMRELGAPVGMPLMKLRHDSSNHNYSSARFDATSYQRANETIQKWLWRRRVKPLVLMGLSEAMLVGRLAPRSTRRLKLYGRWDQPPHADPVKEAMAGQIRLNSRSSSPIMEALAQGKDFEQIAAEWKRANELLEQNGMPPMLGPVGGQLTDLENWLTEDDEGEQGGGSNVTS